MLQNIYCWYLPKLTPVIRFNMLIFKKNNRSIYCALYRSLLFHSTHSFFLSALLWRSHADGRMHCAFTSANLDICLSHIHSMGWAVIHTPFPPASFPLTFSRMRMECMQSFPEERGVTRLHNARSSRIFLMLIHAIKECRLIINRPTIHQSSHVSQTRSDDAVKVGQNLLRHVDPHKVMRKRHSLPLKTHFNCCFIFRLTV